MTDLHDAAEPVGDSVVEGLNVRLGQVLGGGELLVPQEPEAALSQVLQARA